MNFICSGMNKHKELGVHERIFIFLFFFSPPLLLLCANFLPLYAHKITDFHSGQTTKFINLTTETLTFTGQTANSIFWLTLTCSVRYCTNTTLVKLRHLPASFASSPIILEGSTGASTMIWELSIICMFQRTEKSKTIPLSVWLFEWFCA